MVLTSQAREGERAREQAEIKAMLYEVKKVACYIIELWWVRKDYLTRIIGRI